jgi:hypothetical protein
VGLGAVILAAFVIDAVVEDRVIPEPVGQVSVPDETPTPQTQTLSDDLSEWDATGPGQLAAADEKGESVWTAKGSGYVTWPQSLGDLVFDVGFRFPKGSVDSGVVVRIPDTDLEDGVEVTLDAEADGAARVGYVDGLVDPLVFVDAQPNEWHTLQVSVSGERVIVSVDGRHIADWADLEGEGRMADQGSVALRFSDGISFRGVRLAESAQVSEVE